MISPVWFFIISLMNEITVAPLVALPNFSLLWILVKLGEFQKLIPELEKVQISAISFLSLSPPLSTYAH